MNNLSTHWFYPAKGIAVRLFLTCWLVYVVHFATNIVREIFPALALGDHFSFRVDEYANMHPDLFEKPGYGWHIGNNPGVSMLAAIPYALSRPVIDPIVRKVNQTRISTGQTQPPDYDSPWQMAREFYAEAWRRGFDVKFGLAAFVMQAFCMAPMTALSVVVMFYLMRSIFHSDKTALGLSLLYAFATPVFFRTGTLNQNLMMGIISFIGFVLVWNPFAGLKWSKKTRYFLAGLTGGCAVLFDYSGLVLLIGLFIYSFIKELKVGRFKSAARLGLVYILGSIGPIALLWFYQWRSFGNPFLPGQHWMPPVQWIELGYKGYGLPQLELLKMLLFDYRFGFFVASPIMLLALFTPFIDRGHNRKIPILELSFIIGLFLAFWIFFGGSNYTRLQFNTGIRYMTAVLPFMFIPAAVTLMRLPGWAIGLITIMSVTESWALAMYREVESRLGILDPLIKTFVIGFQLPALRTLSRLGAQYGVVFPENPSSIPFLLLVIAILVVIWYPYKKTQEENV